jgi:hypothetical protein
MLCRAVDVWERCADGTAIRYRCFELLGQSKFWVHTSEFYRREDDERVRRAFELDFVELFAANPTDSYQLFDSLSAAVKQHREESVVRWGRQA